jgi:DNA invertase Pin-like site-specific DNA recombinase
MPKGVEITDEQRAEIQSLIAEDRPVKQIARRVHLSPTTVHRVANGPKARAKPRAYRVTLNLTMTQIGLLLEALGPDVYCHFGEPE